MLRPTRVVDKNNFSYNKNIVINTPNNIQNPNNKMSSDEINQNIQVFVRCRPLNTNEKKAVIDIVPEKRMIRTQQQNKIYSFDGVFNHDAKQTKVYRAVVEPLVEQVIEGYNCTVFAYGQTGTGKTYTMIGGHIDHNGSWEDDPLSGIIPRAIDQLLEELENQNAEYTIGVSFLELYNEDAYDLLSPLSDTTKLRIYNDAERKGSVIISGLVEMIVRSKAEIFEILTKGSLKRQTAPTLMNACSSRSHSIFSVTVHIKEITLDGEEVVKIGKLNLVDLAGSENIGRSGAVEERAREASNINKSLLTLGRVITSLVEKSSHIPYRDSKLTRLLQDSLGGRTKTSIIATISPCQDDIEDTISTLDYAQRAKKITNKPEINLKMSKKALINEYLQEIDRLRRDLEAARDKKGVFVDAKNYAYMEQTLEAQKQDLETKEAKLEHMKQEMEKMNHLLTQANNDISQKAQELADTMFELNQLTSEYQIAQLSLKQKQIEIKKVKLLLSAHRNNEEKLLKKANLVKTIADQCTNDNSKLMEKIDNLKSIETNNVNSIQNFSVAYDEQLNKIEQLNNLYLTILNDGHNSIDSIITENRQQLKMNEEKFAKNSNILNEKIENFLEKFMNNIQTDFNELIDKNTLLEAIMMDVKSFIKNEFEMYEQNYLNILKKNFELLNEIEKMDQQYRNHQEQEIMSKIVQVNESSLNIKAMIKSIAEDNEKNYQLKCKEKEISSKKLNNMKLMIETMNNEKQIRSIENILNEIRQNQSKNISMINENIEYFETYLQNSLSNDFKYDENLKMKCSEIHHQINRNDKNIVEFLNDIDEHSLKNHEINCKQFSLMKNEQQKSSENFKNFSSKILTSINSAFDKCSEQNQSIKESISNQIYDYQMDNDEFNDDCNELINDNQLTIDTIMKLVNEQSNQTIANLDQIKNSMNALKIAQSSKTNNMKLEAKKLIENYKKYQPNGDTPKRINYQYPQTFTPTSPYDRILSRIQSEKLDQSPLVLSFEENEENSEVNDNDASASMNKTYCIDANSIENNLHNSKSSRILTTKN